MTGSPWEMLWFEIIQQGQFQATDVAKRNCCATGTGSGLTHCFLFGQSGGQRSTTLPALSFFSGTHFSPRRQSFAQVSFARFDESCRGIWWLGLEPGLCTVRGPGEKGLVVGGREGMPKAAREAPHLHIKLVGLHGVGQPDP